MPVMKTPGVYIVEQSTFPTSIVEVATAVPAFIGYTERADNQGKTLENTPWRISSLTEYHQYFGMAPTAKFVINERPSVSNDALQSADDKKMVGDAVATEQSSLAAGLLPTLPIDTDTVVPSVPTAFKLGAQEYLLTQLPGAAGGRFLLYYGMRQFFQNGGGPCYIVSVGGYNADAVEAGKLADGIDLLIKEREPTMLVLPDCMLLKVDDCISVQQKALTHCGNVMRNRVAILDVWGGDRAINEGPIAEFRDKLGINCLDFAAAYYPWLNTNVVQDNELSYANIDNLAVLQSLLRLELKLPIDPTTANASPKVKALQKTVTDLTNTPKDWAAASAAAGDNKAKTEQEQAADARMQSQLLNKSLLALSPMFNSVLGALKNRLNLLPPSAAMAGIYTMVDNTRGVWKAPANVSLTGVISPAVNLSPEDQEDLNVTTQGKSINAIRSFNGEGVLVWGARTLDGNSLDWRYINVRRTMIMLEESCRLAAMAMVFERNVANTWVTIKSMIQNFLTGIWKRGGLAGAVPNDAFSVHVGLGQTMSPEDILEGLLRVTILVAISRPAEFIEITFQQQMQKS